MNAAPGMAIADRLGRMGARLASATSGLTAIGVKELRGRMRGRRAFTVLTIYLVVIGGFAWMVDVIAEQSYRASYGGQVSYAAASIGKGVFTALLFLETLLVTVLAPAFTAGAISLEREKQTLDMLATTPISSLAIVAGKLLTALTYVFVLILASVPLTGLVFLFGGVGPEDLLRGYLVLLVTAIGLGSVALFFSALIKRTQAATILSYVTVLFLTLGSIFVFIFLDVLGSGARSGGIIGGRPSEALLYLNPFVAQADVLCGTEDVSGGMCGPIEYVTARPSDFDNAGQGGFAIRRDSFWPKSALAWLSVAVILTLLAAQLVSPTRRWRPHLGRRRGPPREVSE